MGEQVYLATDLDYLTTTYNLYGMPNVRHLKEKSKRGIFSFEVIDDPAFIGVLIQVTSRGRVNIYLPKGAPKEEVVEKTLKLLEEANKAPIKVLGRKEGPTMKLSEREKMLEDRIKEDLKLAFYIWASLIIKDGILPPPEFFSRNVLENCALYLGEDPQNEEFRRIFFKVFKECLNGLKEILGQELYDKLREKLEKKFLKEIYDYYACRKT